MSKIYTRFIIVISILGFAALACSLPGTTAPTPFIFPTPNQTMTAVFNPTQLVEATGLPPTETFPSPTPPPPTAEPTFTPTATPTLVPPTIAPTNTPVPTQSFAGPGMRQTYSVAGIYLDSAPTIDGNLGDWGLDKYSVDNVVYGADLRNSPSDLSGTVMVGWDEDYLYIGMRVRDDEYVQKATGINLFKGDSIEILLDTDVSGDYYLKNLDGDDFQLGISPGSPKPGDDYEAYLWFPRSLEGKRSNVKIGAETLEDGYRIEVAIPWSIFEVTPKNGKHYGFAVSISDNDKSGENVQQSMVSNVPTRRLTDPTTWGDLTLINP